MFKEYKIVFIKSNNLKSIINLHLEICKETYKHILSPNLLIYFHNIFINERRKICFSKNKEINLVVKYKNTNKIVAFADAGPMRKYEGLEFMYNKRVLEIKKFFLHPCCQGKGLSKNLFIKIIKDAINKYSNYSTLIILSFKDNMKANQFYKKLGGKIYKSLKYKINNIYYDVICYKWINIHKLINDLK